MKFRLLENNAGTQDDLEYARKLVRECIHKIEPYFPGRDFRKVIPTIKDINPFGQVSIKTSVNYTEYYLLTLNTHHLKDDETLIKNTIYHELAHVLVDMDCIKNGTYFYDYSSGRWVGYRNKSPKPHGKEWEAYCRQLEKIENVGPLTVTGKYTPNTRAGRDARMNYVVTCKTCGQKLQYKNKTEFVQQCFDVKAGKRTATKYICARCNKDNWDIEVK